MFKRAIIVAACLFAAPAMAQTPPLNVTKLSATATIGGPGVYEVTTAGITVTLPSWTGWAAPAKIVIKDATGNASPNITVAASTGTTIDGAASVTLLAPNQGEVFEPFQGGSWVVGGNYVAIASGANAAPAGSPGEIISSDIPTASAVAQSVSGTAVSVTSVALTPGDWDCTASVVTKPAGSTTTSRLAAAISGTDATLPTVVENGQTIFSAPQAAGIAEAIPVPLTVELVSANTTVFLVGDATFATSTMSLYGQIICRRMR